MFHHIQPYLLIDELYSRGREECHICQNQYTYKAKKLNYFIQL